MPERFRVVCTIKALCNYLYLYLYLDFCSPIRGGTLGDELSPSGTVTVNTPDFMTPISCISSTNVFHHVRFKNVDFDQYMLINSKP